MGMLQMIERAGRDPNFDVEKFERLVAVQQSVQSREDERADREAELEAESAFNTAMAAVQANMGRVSADANNSQTRSRYATYGAMDRALRPLYAPAGFALSFSEETGAASEGYVRVVCYVTHTAPGAKRSHTRKYHVDMAADGKGAKGNDVMTKTHAIGSAFTYGRRYLLGMIFNLAIGDDDDGNAAGVTGPVINAAQLTTLEELAKEVKANVEQACKYLKINSLAELPAAKFDNVVKLLEAKRSPL
jgi:hypothetical protein